MGWFNPDVSWAELERQMSGRTARDKTVDNPEADSAPGYSHKRPAYAADPSWCSGRASRWCRTPSCTATATSASWTGRAIRRS